MKAFPRFGRLAYGVSFLLLSAFVLAIAGTGGYHLLNKYPFAAAEGSTRDRFDYITVDSAARRVYLSHGTEIKVIDADSGSLIGNVTGLKDVHGVAVAAEFGRDSSRMEARGTALRKAGRDREAMDQFEEAARLQADRPTR